MKLNRDDKKEIAKTALVIAGACFIASVTISPLIFSIPYTVSTVVSSAAIAIVFGLAGAMGGVVRKLSEKK